MFTSINNNSNSNNKHNSYHYYYTSTDQQHSMLDRSFTNDVSPNFKHDHHHHHTHLPSYFPFSSSYAASSNEDDVQLFQQHQDLMNMSHLNQRTLAVPGAKTNKVVDVNAPIDPSFANDHNQRNGQADQIPQKRSSKKDRHSKIITAQGPRDRRMRLSLPVARKFFPLQDMLGFDKASKTVEWLMKHADSEIRKLYRVVSQAKSSCSRSEKSVSSTSECEVVSGIDEINNSEDIQQESILDGKAPASNAKESKKVRRKLVFNPHAKESRAMARARARERTVEKKRSTSQHPCLQGLKHLTSSSSFEKGEESNSHCHDLKYSSDQVIDMENISHQGPMNDIAEEDSFSITTKANQSSIFGYNHEITISQGASSSNFNFPNYLGNWETNLDRTSSSHSMINKNQSSGNAEEQIPSSFPLTPMDSTFPFQFADILFCRPCEPYDSHGLS